jgi:diguanylate cyclase (GGDEF)-like protein
VLRAIAQRCHTNIRQVDILGRYGGDEFAILLPQTEMKKAHEIAERIRQAVIQTPIAEIHISISLGIAQATEDMDNLSTLLGRADAALYAAKQSGRNRVMQDHLPTY